MASSLISSSHHIDFDSVFSMEDASLAPMFESLITTGLKKFLGCPAIFYEAALTEFFANGSVRDGLVVSTELPLKSLNQFLQRSLSYPMRLDSVDIQSIQEFESASSDGSIVYRSPSPILQKNDSFDQEEPLYIVESPESSPSIPQQQESTRSSSDSQIQFDSNDFPLDDTTEAQTSLPAATVDLSSLLDELKSSLSQRMDDANSEILSRLHSTERSLQTSLGHQNDYLRSLIQSARQEGQIQDDVQILRLNVLKKAVIVQGISADTESLDIRNKFNALDAKILLLDGQFAAIRSEQLEFQAKIAADLLSLSTQIGDLVEYIRRGDAKKGRKVIDSVNGKTRCKLQWFALPDASYSVFAAVDRQSGPRPESIFLRQSTLEDLTDFSHERILLEKLIGTSPITTAARGGVGRSWGGEEEGWAALSRVMRCKSFSLVALGQD
ncbi:vacuolar proton ATPase a1-like [Dorcoceras hygrometricum]|uniref:Vacuolar proton ATPase a1-like n=1 Tax=Dorcoceras hygrometricum TaxID=472368 RepID=A0A2Z7B092_9LAMI|nr:vacuolar proton ATPase a1-like [Dorcoceras hygrometricum]